MFAVLIKDTSGLFQVISCVQQLGMMGGGGGGVRN